MSSELLRTAPIEEVRSRFLHTYNLEHLDDITLNGAFSLLTWINYYFPSVTKPNDYDSKESDALEISLLEDLRAKLKERAEPYKVLFLGGGSVGCMDESQRERDYEPWLARLLAYCGCEVVNVDVGMQLEEDVGGQDPLLRHLNFDILDEGSESELSGEKFDLILCEGVLSNMPSAPVLGRLRDLDMPEEVFAQTREAIIKNIDSIHYWMGTKFIPEELDGKNIRELFKEKRKLMREFYHLAFESKDIDYKKRIHLAGVYGSFLNDDWLFLRSMPDVRKYAVRKYLGNLKPEGLFWMQSDKYIKDGDGQLMEYKVN
ncbi:MAG: hypothetical protein US52_C0021G0005 [candidate division WS6 bacterium GW2011_GWA2_37_6]|uniref:Uncharacterized protein n=1 Tax=candidate division WS6 bacterium GW2011_GWA2_37_6 TaxID=1619087 RepID=A0A0G0HAR6_9BACT|nr:MAG: hypothetical protein US52_C0021G0005 [candidate division WS6 bacterium GW2011_GWA2_37_6]